LFREEGRHADLEPVLADVFEGCPEALIPVLRGELPGLSRLVRTIEPGFRGKALAIVPVWSAGAGQNPGRCLRRLMHLARRLSHPPFAVDGRGVSLWRPFTELEGAAWSRFRNGPDEAFLILEKNAPIAGLDRVIDDMVTVCGNRCGDDFIRTPPHFFAAVRTMAAARSGDRLELLARWLAHPITGLEAGMPFEALCKTVYGHLPAGVPSPVPRKLRRVLRDEVTLTGHQEARLRQQLGQALGQTALGLLARLAKGAP